RGVSPRANASKGMRDFGGSREYHSWSLASGTPQCTWQLALGLLVVLQLCLAGPARAQGVDVFVNPATQTAAVGAPVSVEIRLNANSLTVCSGGVFLQFDTSRLSAFCTGAGTCNTSSGVCTQGTLAQGLTMCTANSDCLTCGTNNTAVWNLNPVNV